MMVDGGTFKMSFPPSQCKMMLRKLIGWRLNFGIAVEQPGEVGSCVSSGGCISDEMSSRIC